MKALPFLQTLSAVNLRSQDQYSSQSSDLARMPKGTQKKLQNHVAVMEITARQMYSLNYSNTSL